MDYYWINQYVRKEILSNIRLIKSSQILFNMKEGDTTCYKQLWINVQSFKIAPTFIQ